MSSRKAGKPFVHALSLHFDGIFVCFFLSLCDFRSARSIEEASAARGSTIPSPAPEAPASDVPGAAGSEQEPLSEATMIGAGKSVDSVLFCYSCMIECSLSPSFWLRAAASPPPAVSETVDVTVPGAQVLNPPIAVEAEAEDPATAAAKEAAVGAEGAGASASRAVVPLEVVPATETATEAVVALVSPPDPATHAQKSEAGGLDARQKKNRKVAADSTVASLPSLFSKVSELGPDVPEETKAVMDGATEEMKLFCSSIQRLGLSVEPRFMVSPCHLFCAYGSDNPQV